jgi:hypothetical protein
MRNNMNDERERGLDKLIVGAPAIAAAVNELALFDQPITASVVERRLTEGQCFPATKFGGRWSTTRRRLLAALTPLQET